MIYVFDSNAFSQLFRSYYRGRFPSLWNLFDEMVEDGSIISTREVLREIEDSSIESLRDWSADNKAVFTTPTAAEGAFLAKIFSVSHFQQNIEQRKLYKGGKNADAFIVAKAAVIDGTVISLEQEKPKAARVPNICTHFEVPCMSLEEFMEAEEWEF